MNNAIWQNCWAIGGLFPQGTYLRPILKPKNGVGYHPTRGPLLPRAVFQGAFIYWGFRAPLRGNRGTPCAASWGNKRGNSGAIVPRPRGNWDPPISSTV